MDKDDFPAEPASCYDYRMCMYYVAIGKYESDCKLEFMQCCKERNYMLCKDIEYRWQESKEQECWDKLR
jgi:hypothetical protein